MAMADNPKITSAFGASFSAVRRAATAPADARTNVTSNPGSAFSKAVL